MSDTTTPADLTVPANALAFWARPHDVLLTDADVAERIRDVAAPVVAAELRRLSDHYGERAKRRDEHPSSNDYDGSDQYVWGEGHGYSEVADDLLARADELDPS
jgi:hypothetical protein